MCIKEYLITIGIEPHPGPPAKGRAEGWVLDVVEDESGSDELGTKSSMARRLLQNRKVVNHMHIKFLSYYFSGVIDQIHKRNLSHITFRE